MDSFSPTDRAINRRRFLGYGGAAAAGFLIGGRAAFLLAQDTRGLANTKEVQITSGRVRGLVRDRINAFYGIPYGAPTDGANRFMPPAKPQSWGGVRDCFEYGPRSPQGPSGLIPEDAAEDRRESASEDCLRLNVWTPMLGSGRRPVMVWLHGGGYSQASGSYIIYDGANLSRRRDVVIVTLNHRLNAFGYLYLAELGGAKYADSGNVGMLDIVQALQWVRDNISAFGGDPNNVTIFGQSGGGGKVCTLLGMTPAKGLFHKAIAESGSNVTGLSKEAATRSAENLLARLNLKRDQLDELQKMPVDRIVAAMSGGGGRGAAGGAVDLGPVVDGKNLPAGPFSPVSSPLSASVPLLTGSVEDEVTFIRGTPLDEMDDSTLKAQITRNLRVDDKAADRLIAVYRKGRPGIGNVQLYQILASDGGFREGVLEVAERKADAKQAPVYMYYFTWKSPVRDGKLRSFHTLEIPFVFENVDLATAMTGGHQDRYALQDRMSAAWTNFARTGDPNVKGLLPEWPSFDATRRATMILDQQCNVINDPNGDERRELNASRQGVRNDG
jgi:para-nitrobenzyl esterase